MPTDDYQNLIRESILGDETFVSATFSGHQRGHTSPWKKVLIRPVLIKQARHLQFSYFDDRKDISKNYSGDDIRHQLDELLAEPFKNFAIVTSRESIQINLTKKGKPIISRIANDASVETRLTHNRQKKKILTEGEAIPYLQAVGIMTADGRVKTHMQNKFKQINEFLRLLAETEKLDTFDHQLIEVIDFGCGNAYLTFATYHYLTELLGLQTHMVGIDTKADLLEKHAWNARELGWRGLTFEESLIGDYRPATPPDIVIALHACDTATDDAIAQGIRANSKIIVCAPCCQHDLQVQLEKTATPAPFVPIMSCGLFHERIGDILTDSFRALILKMMGYHVDVVQFVPAEHTPKNLMIRAVKAAKIGNAKHIREYLELKDYWKVHPYLHRLLEAEIDQVIAQRSTA